jgi:triacylglycerol lipase
MTAFARFDPEASGYNGRNALALGLASKLAYEDADKVLETLDRWGFAASRFLDRGGTQGFMASTDKMLLIAFRGTELEQLRDILTDINLALTQGPVGKVHTGFARALDKVWPDFKDQFDGLYQGQPVWLTGHSLGAALATLATARLVFHPDRRRVQGLYTYGSPRVGDEVFAKEFNQACLKLTFRFRNHNDIVTRVPLPGVFRLRYRHVGKLCYFDADGNLHFKMTSWEQLFDRLRGRIEDLGKPGTDSMKDHAIDAYLEKLERNQNVPLEKAKGGFKPPLP